MLIAVKTFQIRKLHIQKLIWNCSTSKLDCKLQHDECYRSLIQWRRHEGGRGGSCPPHPPSHDFNIFFMFLLVSSAVMAMIVPPTPLWKLLWIFFWSQEKNVSESPPPPPSALSDLFQGWRKMLWLAQQLRDFWQFCPPYKANTLAPPLALSNNFDLPFLISAKHWRS